MASWRKNQAHNAWTARYENAQRELEAERGVLEYLRSQSLTGAAERVEKNIRDMETRVLKYKDMIPPKES